MFSRMLPIRQYLPDRSIADLPAEVRKQLDSSEFTSTPRRGGRSAIGVGSRGIANIATIVRSAVAYWNEAGYKPFIFPVMGSHGAATAEGQAQVLARYGIDEATMGAPIVSSLEVVSLGRTHDGIEVFMDRNAYSSDGVMLIGLTPLASVCSYVYFRLVADSVPQGRLKPCPSYEALQPFPLNPFFAGEWRSSMFS
jgi:hypothetical protein